MSSDDRFYFREDGRINEEIDKVRREMEAALAEAEASGVTCPDVWLNQ